jgi:hypothetical protein
LASVGRDRLHHDDYLAQSADRIALGLLPRCGLKRSWAVALSALTFFSPLAFAGVTVTGQDFVMILLGEKWAFLRGETSPTSSNGR